MIIITRKAKLVAAPEPPFVGTTCVFAPTAEAPSAGILGGTLAWGHEAATIDWGDGTVERVASISKLVHAYANPGLYTARISDDLTELRMSMSRSNVDFVIECAGQLHSVVSNATLLTALGSGCFARCRNLVSLDISQTKVSMLPYCVCKDCASLTGRVDFPHVTELVGQGVGYMPFEGCTSLSEIRFAEANRAAIEASEAYQIDPRLGAVNARVTFG